VRTHARRRVRRANPKRRHAARTSARRTSRRNPSRRRFAKRRSRRNPGLPLWALAALAGGLGLVTFAVGQAGSFALTQRTDPSRATLDRNRYIGFGVLTAAGIAIAATMGKKSPVALVLGAGVAVGGAIGLGGTELSLAIGRVVDKTTSPAVLAQPPSVKGLGAVYGAGAQQFGAVYGGGDQKFFGMGSGVNGIGATFRSGSQQFGNMYDDEAYFGG